MSGLFGGYKVNFLRRLFYNMYGIDNYGRFTIISSIILNLLGGFFRVRALVLLGEVLFLYSAFRFISKNKQKRFLENQKFLKLKSNFMLKYSQANVRLKDTKNNYFKCPRCKTYLSVPKGVGKVCIVCRKCNHQFVKKSK